jgi:hypothetical protein
MVTEYGSNHEVLLCEVDANPQRIVDGSQAVEGGPHSEVEVRLKYQEIRAGIELFRIAERYITISGNQRGKRASTRSRVRVATTRAGFST